MAPTVIAKKQASPSRCAGSKRAQLPRCRSKHRKGMSGANAYTATTELRYLIELFLPGNVAGQIFRSCMRQKNARSPTGEQSETASFTPFALARCETAREPGALRGTRTAEVRRRPARHSGSAAYR